MVNLLVMVAGFSVLALGLVMIVLPGPAFIVIPLGIGILATRFEWARRLLDKVRYVVEKRRGKKRGRG